MRARYWQFKKKDNCAEQDWNAGALTQPSAKAASADELEPKETTKQGVFMVTEMGLRIAVFQYRL